MSSRIDGDKIQKMRLGVSAQEPSGIFLALVLPAASMHLFRYAVRNIALSIQREHSTGSGRFDRGYILEDNSTWKLAWTPFSLINNSLFQNNGQLIISGLEQPV